MSVDKNKKFSTLEETIYLLQQEGKNKWLSIEEILRILSGKGRPFILILLSLPFCQPIQIPGLSTPFGLVIAFIALRMTFGKRIWLPKKLLHKKISKNTLSKITDKSLILIKKMKPLVHPRLTWLSRSPLMEKGNGLMIFLLGILLALPLPIPLSNLIPAWAILLMAFGVLEDDGLFILLGTLLFLCTIAFFLALGFGLEQFF